MHFAKFLKGLDTSIQNKGEELVITVKGDKEKLAQLERKLGALNELCCGGGCCSDDANKECC